MTGLTTVSAVRAALSLLVLAMTSTAAHAQAWLPAKGEGTVSMVFTNSLSTRHYLPDVAYDRGHIDANTTLLDVTYGLTDRIAVTVGLPMVTSRYRGSFPHQPITLDDGNWHTSAQDWRMNVRYNVARGPIQITPFAGTELPANDYQYYAHAAPGRQLKEGLAGVSVGRLFAELGLVVQGQYAINLSQGALEYARRYSTASVESAYFLTPSWRFIVTAASRIGHTGIDLPLNAALLTPDQRLHHDQISRESYFNLGGATAISLSETTDLFVGYTRTMTGRNTHAIDRGLSLGLSWSFGHRRGAGGAALASRDSREGSLVRCVCEKKAGV
ncbi:MAG TPA: hypothetical protein VKB50_16070 [Vicinamibacterales bacterium]|nr:hypothetical protein [Vicinamibacterales bacterium]